MKVEATEVEGRKVYSVRAFNNGVAEGLERRREEFVESLERRLGDMESELRRRLQALVAETDSERATLDTRLSELTRRVDELLARSRERLGAGAG